MSNNPFNWSNDQLVQAMANACARAGRSNSGLCIDVGAPYDMQEATFLKSVVLAKLDGANPPFSPGEKVSLQKGCSGWSMEGRNINPSDVLTVRRLFYKEKGGSDWHIQFKEIEGSRGIALYDANNFKKVSKKT